MATWWQAAVSLLVGLMTASGAYLGVRHTVRGADRATAQRELAARREEWRQRFSLAAEYALDDSPQKRAAGMAMLAKLRGSELAREDDVALLDEFRNRTRRAVRLAEVEDSQRSLVKVRRRVLGDDHPDTVRAVGDLAATLEKRENFPEAEEWLRVLVKLRERLLGEDHPETQQARTTLANLVRRSAPQWRQPPR
ncbi:tetratricopeptide repeat protein [Saccharopolyspora sp. NPDC000359]|uniref:tetratricopeptide repeat protein n=1 Tax=Saccharopolyspora sp. NPDC000359 TaxID=3154251 RepID=UPI0033172245